MERKASEVLISLENDIKSCLSYLKNIDNNYKIILSKINNLEISGFNSKKNNPQPLALPQVVDAPSAPSISSEKPPIIKKSKTKSTLDENKIKIHQVLTYPPTIGKNVLNIIMAKIVVYDEQGQPGGNKILETRSDQNGRWKAELDIGKYFVHIVKPATKEKPQIDHYFTIDLDGTKSIVELPTYTGV